MEVEVKTVYVAWTNEDLTEGRGQEYPFCVCESESTAIRKGENKGVMNSDAYVTEEFALCHKGKWYVPGRITRPTAEDVLKDKRESIRKAAIDKAKQAGLTDTDITAIITGVIE